MGYDTALADQVTEELRLIRQNVPGVRGSITATKDGLLLAHDMHGLEPTQIAALVAATHAVAVRASLSTECGQLKEVITRGTDGYLAVYGAERSGAPVIVAVLGTSELNVAMLNFRARTMIERIAEQSAGLARGPRADPAAPEQDVDGADAPLPARRGEE
jgi:predicted regulator of Ras-like GTPase activity (Roadblock/LC7/MglB family)